MFNRLSTSPERVVSLMECYQMIPLVGILRKMKVSYFSMGDLSLWQDDNERSRIRPGEPHHGKNIMTLSTRVLSQVHFPSLKKLEFRFPAGKAFTNADYEVRDSFILYTLPLVWNMQQIWKSLHRHWPNHEIRHVRYSNDIRDLCRKPYQMHQA